MIIFPERPFGFVLSGMRTQFGNNDTLPGCLQRQGHQNGLNVGPILNDELGIDFTDGS